MKQSLEKPVFVPLEEPRFEKRGRFVIAGLSGTCDEASALWERFAPQIGNVPKQLGSAAYGVCFNPSSSDDSAGYLAGVEVAEASATSGGWTIVTIPPQRYAVFPHPGHVSEIRNTVHTIVEKWLSATGHKEGSAAPGAPAFLE